MKKTKQNIYLSTACKKSSKAPLECKYSTSKKNTKQKKIKDILHKENKSQVAL